MSDSDVRHEIFGDSENEGKKPKCGTWAPWMTFLGILTSNYRVTLRGRDRLRGSPGQVLRHLIGECFKGSR